MTSVWAIEVVASDRFHRSVLLPFLWRYLKDRGVAGKWVRFAVPARLRTRMEGRGLSLPDEDLESLKRLLAAPETRPTHLLLSHEPARELLRIVEETCGSCRVGIIGAYDTGETDKGVQSPEIPSLPPTIAAIDDFVGLQNTPLAFGHLWEDFEPCFMDWIPGNRAALECPPLPFLVMLPDCTYSRTIGSNPHFQGLNAEVRSWKGCTFCLRPPPGNLRRPAFHNVLQRQLKGLAASFQGWKGRLAVRLAGDPFLQNVEEFVRLALSYDLPPCDFLLDGRPDLLLRRRKRLEAGLEALQGSKHRLHVCLVGVENFSNEELARFNKGITAKDNLQVIEMLLDLERDYPERFDFRSYGGLSLILFTPWTRPQDLAFNLSLIRLCRIEDLSGKVFASRLRLYKRLPLYVLARHDGLLSEAYDDPALDTARANLYPDEVPWRFRDPRMESVCRLLVRFPDAACSDDSLTSEVVQVVRQATTAQERLGLALSILDSALQEEAPLPPLDLLRMGHSVWKQGADHNTPSDPPHLEPLETAVAAVLSGIKPVARLEGCDARQWRVHWRKLPHVPAVKECPVGGIDTVWLARDASLLDEAISTAKAQFSSEEEERAATRRHGQLLGYPDCCVEAFMKFSGDFRDHFGLELVLRRVEGPEEVSPWLNPRVTLVEYCPCSYTCAPTIERAQRILEAIRTLFGEATAKKIIASALRPSILIPDDWCVIEIEPLQEPSERFGYRTIFYTSRHPLAALIEAGDEIVLDETGLNVLSRGRLVGALGMRAFLWWHRRVFHRELWRVALSIRKKNVDALRRTATNKVRERPAKVIDERAARLARFIEAVLKGQEVEGFRLAHLEPLDYLAVKMEFASENERLVLLAMPSRLAPKAFDKAGPLAFVHPEEEPLDTMWKVRAARKIAALLGNLAVQARRRAS